MKATSHHSTLVLNQGNHPAVPEEGLVLVAGVQTPVPAELGDYLRTLGVEIETDPAAIPTPTARAARKE